MITNEMKQAFFYTGMVSSGDFKKVHKALAGLRTFLLDLPEQNKMVCDYLFAGPTQKFTKSSIFYCFFLFYAVPHCLLQ
jgi:hypothetical protein